MRPAKQRLPDAGNVASELPNEYLTAKMGFDTARASPVKFAKALPVGPSMAAEGSGQRDGLREADDSAAALASALRVRLAGGTLRFLAGGWGARTSNLKCLIKKRFRRKLDLARCAWSQPRTKRPKFNYALPQVDWTTAATAYVREEQKHAAEMPSMPRHPLDVIRISLTTVPRRGLQPTPLLSNFEIFGDEGRTLSASIHLSKRR